MTRLRNILIIIPAMFLLFACGSSSVKLDDVASDIDARNVESVDPLKDPRGELARRSIYFDFDSYMVKDEYQSIVQAHSRFLNQNKNRRIVIEGNTDERGGREYNLALGQKRAEAVRRSMSLLGVNDSQMEAISLGKEKPRALGSNESAWSENRRSDIVYE